MLRIPDALQPPSRWLQLHCMEFGAGQAASGAHHPHGFLQNQHPAKPCCLSSISIRLFDGI